MVTQTYRGGCHRGDIAAVSLACRDDSDTKVSAEVPVRFADGLNNNGWNPPAETRHL